MISSMNAAPAGLRYALDLTQGVALGYHNSPFQGRQHTRKHFYPRALVQDLTTQFTEDKTKAQ